jgi:quinol monooxygenase YgiN
MIYLIATLKVETGMKNKLAEVVEPCLEGTRKEKGNISYDLMVNIKDDTSLVFVERWESMEALNNHFTEPHFLKWREALTPHLLDRKIEIISGGEVEVR